MGLMMTGNACVNELMNELGKPLNMTTEQVVLRRTDCSNRKTKIVCTMGPSCWSVETLVKMIDAGMNVARLNFSHGDHETHARTLQNLREALQQRPGAAVSVMLDTKGPEIRTGMLKNGDKVTLKQGQDLKIVTDYTFAGDETTIACSYKKLPQSVQPGGIILVADGTITLKVKTIGQDHVVTTVLNGAVIGERKNMNLPNVKVDLPVCGEREKNDILQFGLPQKCDMIAASFTQSADDVRYIREILGEKGRHIKIIPKIENAEGILNFDEILAEADGIMVARGDMGMEIPPEKVFLAQKMMIAKCNMAGKPVITATQMLESMIKNPRPTRAEASDVANAVLDGTDCVMLSGESAGGAFPVEAVTVLAKIAVEAEACLNYPLLFKSLSSVVRVPCMTADSVCCGAVHMALNLVSPFILVITETGLTAALVGKYRPCASIVVVTSSSQVQRDMQLYRGVVPYLVPHHATLSSVKPICEELLTSGKVTRGTQIVVIEEESVNLVHTRVVTV